MSLETIARKMTTYPIAGVPEFTYPFTREERDAVLNVADSELRKAVETADRYRARLTDELTPEEQLAISTMIEFWASGGLTTPCNRPCSAALRKAADGDRSIQKKPEEQWDLKISPASCAVTRCASPTCGANAQSQITNRN